MKIDKMLLKVIYEEFEYLNIPKNELEKFESKLIQFNLKKNEYLVREGEIPDKIAFVISGLFRAFYLTNKAEEKTIVFRGKGKVLSTYSSFVKNENSKFSIQALEDSTVLYISIKDFEDLILGDNFWQIITGKYFMNIYIEKEARERELLSNDAKTNYEKFLRDYPGFINKINHYHIASYLGISNVSLSRIRNDKK